MGVCESPLRRQAVFAGGGTEGAPWHFMDMETVEERMLARFLFLFFYQINKVKTVSDKGIEESTQDSSVPFPLHAPVKGLRQPAGDAPGVFEGADGKAYTAGYPNSSAFGP